MTNNATLINHGTSSSIPAIGGSVTNHLSQPNSFGLYKNAAMESGSFTPWSAHPMWHAEMVFARTMELVSIDKDTSPFFCLCLFAQLSLSRSWARARGTRNSKSGIYNADACSSYSLLAMLLNNLVSLLFFVVSLSLYIE